GQGPVLEFPHLESRETEQSRQREVRYMYFATYHWRPLVNGYSGYMPPPAFEVEERVKRLPEGESVSYLRAIGVRHFVLHPDSRLEAGAGEIARLGRGAARSFPNGTFVVPLPPIATGGEVSLRTAVPTSLVARGRALLGVRFLNRGATYWVD